MAFKLSKWGHETKINSHERKSTKKNCIFFVSLEGPKGTFESKGGRIALHFPGLLGKQAEDSRMLSLRTLNPRGIGFFLSLRTLNPRRTSNHRTLPRIMADPGPLNRKVTGYVPLPKSAIKLECVQNDPFRHLRWKSIQKIRRSKPFLVAFVLRNGI